MLDTETGYATAKAAVESAQADVSTWEGAYADAEHGSFSQSLADVNLSKARSKLQKLEQQAAQAHAQLHSALGIKEAMLTELNICHWKTQLDNRELTTNA